MNRICRLIISFLLFVFLVGCWDSSNIENLSFVMGLGIGNDPNEPEKIGMVTQLYLPLSENNITSKVSYRNKYSTGESVLDAIRNLELIDQGVMSDHQMILVLQNDAVRKWNAEALINQKMRDERTRRGVRVFVTEESLSDVFTYPNGDNSAPASQTLDALAQNNDRSSEIMLPVTLGKLSDSIERGQSMAIPNVALSGDNLKINGAYILKNGVHIDGYLTPQQVSDLNWLTGNVEAGVVNGKMDGHRAVYEILDAGMDSIQTSVQNGQLSMHIKVKSDGRLAENWDPNEDAYNPDYLKKLERLFEQQVTEQVTNTLQELQTSFKTDPIDLQKYARVQQYPFWKQHKDEWDVVFANADITYEVSLSIIDFGTRGKN